MERQEDILGLTLSELAFFIVLVLLLWPLIGNLGATEPEPPEVLSKEDLQEENSKLKESLDLKEQENLRLKERVRVFQEKEGLRSKQKPSCIESGIALGFLFRADIVDLNKYDVNGELVSLSQLLSRFDSDIAEAREMGCTHSIEVSYIEGMGASDYQKSLGELRETFYIQPLSPVPRRR